MRLRRAESIGRPVGDEHFLAGLEVLTRRNAGRSQRCRRRASSCHY